MLLSFFVGRKRREEAVLSYTIRDADAPTTHAYAHVNAMPCYHPSGDPKTARAVSDTAPRTERRGDRRNAPPLMISRSPVWYFCPPDDYLPVVLAGCSWSKVPFSTAGIFFTSPSAPFVCTAIEELAHVRNSSLAVIPNSFLAAPYPPSHSSPFMSLDPTIHST
ncbi:hypothetical protein K457DRAFT_581530 [Linnemannia elongata AG-77]|uniref:Uncharacterized protein n=1 Tax=Linnemannia elongata AG-77 TaxID=1314771 RepID=A0A197KCY5_9FUNG|nr:hypothetical protein K457DRAFT_581530 [Linnemannia elongata AG-77]